MGFGAPQSGPFLVAHRVPQRRGDVFGQVFAEQWNDDGGCWCFTDGSLRGEDLTKLWNRRRLNPHPSKKKKKKSQCQSQNNISEPELPSGYVDFISSVSTRRLVLSPVTLINVGIGVVAYLTSAQYVW